MRHKLRIGIVGAGYIAALHSAAYRTVSGTFTENALEPTLVAVADSQIERAHALQRSWGWERVEGDWRAITGAPDIDLVDICVPNALHHPIAIDAFAHGKHVICEKPLAQNVESALAMWRAAEASEQVAQVCFYYRLWPAIAFAHELVESGRLGKVEHFRGWMLQDYAARPGHDLGWRAKSEAAGSGALGDLGSHIIDVAEHLCGRISVVSALSRTYLPGTDQGTDSVDDLTAMLVRFADGASGVLEAGWAARGHGADLGFDLIAERGALRFSWERSNEIEVLLENGAPEDGMRRVLIGPAHGDAIRFAGVPGQGLGYRDAFSIGIGHALCAVADKRPNVQPSFQDGLRVAQVVAAACEAARTDQWAEVAEINVQPE